jgi:hypothetical protein
MIPAGSAVTPGGGAVVPGRGLSPAGGSVAQTARSGGSITVPNELHDGEDRDVIEAYSTNMVKAGIPQEHVETALAWYRGWVKREAQLEEALHLQDKSALTKDLKKLWGEHYGSKMKAALRVFESLPPAVQYALESGSLADGCAALHAPAVVRWLVDLGSKTSAAFIDAGKASQDILQEIEAIEEAMRLDRTRYNRDERMQARYRELLEAQQRGETTAPQSSRSPIEDEIARLEALMGNKQSEYWKGPKADAMQTRLRELYSLRG